MRNSEIFFPYYSGNIYKSESLGKVNLEQFIMKTRNSAPKLKKLFEEIKQAKLNNDVALKRSLKQQLFSFTPSVMINKGSKRNYSNIINFTGLMQIDLDCIETIHEAVQIKEHIFENYKQIVCAFLSPSRNGVKCLMRIKKPESIDEYKALHQGMVNTFEEYSYLDTATKNAVLPMFLSHDENILFRNFEDCEEWTYADYTKPNYVRLNETPTTSEVNIENKDEYYKRVVRIINSRFDSILDNGHPQVRSTCLVLGSRVAAGYIDESDAKALFEENISRNSYLQKNVRGYLKTGYWAIREGMKSPKYFE